MPNVKGQIVLNVQAQEASYKTMSFMLKNAGVQKPPEVIRAVMRATVAAYLNEYKAVRQGRAKSGALSTKMAQMDVGDSFEWGGVTPQTMRNAMRTAVKLMGNNRARWRLKHTPDTVSIRVTRVEDGDRLGREAPDNPLARYLAAMAVGEARSDSPFKTRQHLGVHVKNVARKMLNKPDAEWRGTTLKNGVQVRRVR